jgi:isopentenyl phosphate kinase
LRNKLLVLKLGGSVITEKARPLTPNFPAIKRLADEIFQAQPSKLILVHGGGSFGHPIAEKYGIADGFKDKSQLAGFSETHEAMVSLNKIILESLLRKGVPAFGMAPSSFIITKSGRIHVFNKETLKQAVKMGLVPVLYGDVVLDLNMGFTVLSGDQLASFLAEKMKAQRLIMGVDVDGIFTDDPKKNPSARLIQHLTLAELKNPKNRISGTGVTDVTGGMLGKVSELTLLVTKGIETMIVNASKSGNIYKVLKGEKVVGTKIEP